MTRAGRRPTPPSQVPDWAGYFTAALAEVPVIRILRGLSPQAAVAAARESWNAGVPLVEVTLERPSGADALAAVVEAGEGRHPVGAGTVTSPQRLHEALRVGAEFAIAPGLDSDTVAAAAEEGVPFLPGVATPSEVGQAMKMGLTVLKGFPADVLGPAWFRALRGPFPDVRLVATGGITVDTASSFLTAGAVGIGLGSGLRGSDLVSLVDEVGQRRRTGPRSSLVAGSGRDEAGGGGMTAP